LQVWANWNKDPKGALAAYKRGLAMGGSRPLPELFAAADCEFESSAETIRPLVQRIRDVMTSNQTGENRGNREIHFLTFLC
jgi:oligoendopeptidase F